jgi:hypothetical protein
VYAKVKESVVMENASGEVSRACRRRKTRLASDAFTRISEDSDQKAVESAPVSFVGTPGYQSSQYDIIIIGASYFLLSKRFLFIESSFLF